MDSYDRMQSIHPGQKLTEEVAKCAIHKEEARSTEQGVYS